MTRRERMLLWWWRWWALGLGARPRHRYLSTSCRHAITDGRPELHHDCQVTAPRHDGSTKVGAKCKHCPSVCVCPVCRHDQSTTSDGQIGHEGDDDG